MNNQLVVAKQKKTIRQRVSQGLAVVTGTALAVPAFAFDATVITEPLAEAGKTVDTAGGAMLTLAVGVMIVGVVIGMVFRKGK